MIRIPGRAALVQVRIPDPEPVGSAQSTRLAQIMHTMLSGQGGTVRAGTPSSLDGMGVCMRDLGPLQRFTGLMSGGMARRSPGLDLPTSSDGTLTPTLDALRRALK